MTTKLNTLETNMDTSTFDDNEKPPPVLSDRSTSALRYLMRDWERYAVIDEDESESDPMVLLNGMVSVSRQAASDA